LFIFVNILAVLSLTLIHLARLSIWVLNIRMKTLIDAMVQTGTLKTPAIIEAFRSVDRADFVPAHYRSVAYEDRPLPLDYDQTISQPSTVAFMFELLQPQPGDKVLDVGSGSGWTTALLAHIVGNTGSVLGLERVEELVEMGRENLAKHPTHWATIEKAGTELGAPERAPFDRILVSAAAHSMPDDLISQLKEGGTMVVPVLHSIKRVVHVEHQPIVDTFEGYVFVPLVTE
jgi:protein-L-isoaspartate(D-aspartate) O-methyltransferase